MFKILLCEDDELARQMLKSYLEPKGHTILEAENGLQALELMKAEMPDVIISDIHMEGMTGIELLESLRKSGNNIPFMLVTGRPDVETYINAIHNLGAFEYIQKPYDLDLLHSILERLMQ